MINLTDTQKKDFNKYVDELANVGNYTESFLKEFQKRSNKQDKIVEQYELVEVRISNGVIFNAEEKRYNDRITTKYFMGNKSFRTWIDTNIIH